MKLRPFLDSLPRGGITDFAKRVGISAVYLSQLAAEQDEREPSPELCVVIERESYGVVGRQELRRNWAAVWPELASTTEAA